MASALEANLGILAALASLGFGLVLSVIGVLSAQRTGSSKLHWVSAGFFLLGLQGGLFALRISRDPVASDGDLAPAMLNLVALVVLYIAVYRRD